MLKTCPARFQLTASEISKLSRTHSPGGCDPPEPQPENPVTLIPVSWNCGSGLVAAMLPKSKMEKGAVRVWMESRIKQAKVSEFTRAGVMVQVSPALKLCVDWSWPIL